jgi:hypothetical protein
MLTIIPAYEHGKMLGRGRKKRELELKLSECKENRVN